MLKHILMILLVVGLLVVSHIPAYATTFTFTVLDVPGVDNTISPFVPIAINTTGQIVGSGSDSHGKTLNFLRAPDGTVTPFDVPGAISTAVTAINDAGQIVGYFHDSTTRHGFLRAPDGTFTTIDPPGSSYTHIDVYAINNIGQIVGEFDDGAGQRHGFLRAPDGTFTTIDAPGALFTGPLAINNAGQIVGVFGDATTWHGFLRAPDGTMTTFDIPGANIHTAPRSINNMGQILGAFTDGSGWHGFLRAPDGTFTNTDPPGAIVTETWALNDLGQIVGAFSDHTMRHGFLRAPDGTFTNTDPPGAVDTQATSINNTGWIVGDFWDGIRYHGFLATPVAALPHIDTLSPTSGPVGTLVTITGTNFGIIQGTSTVTFSSTIAGVFLWSDTQIQVTVPSLAPGSYQVIVTTGIGTSNAMDLLVTTPTFPAWTQLSTLGSPPGRAEHSAVYDMANDKMIIFGGRTRRASDLCLCYLNDVWVLANATGTAGPPTWVALQPSGTAPSERAFHTAVYDPGTDRMIIFGGINNKDAIGNLLNEVWILTHASGSGGTPTWLQLSPTGAAPSPRGLHSAIYNPVTNTMLIFGGGGDGGLMNDLWALSHANGSDGTPAWTQISPLGTSPTVRYGHTAVYDSLTERMLVFGGWGSDALNDSWILTHASGAGGTPTWMAPPVSGTPPSLVLHSAVYDELANTMLIFGGYYFSNNTWKVSNANGVVLPTWVQLSPPGNLPHGRSSHTAVYNTATKQMILFGGHWEDGSGYCCYVNDVWLLEGTVGPVPSVPLITTIDPLSGSVSTPVTIIGSNFGATQGASTVTFGSTLAAVLSWSDTQIQVTVPSLAPGSYQVIVTTGVGTSHAMDFLVTTLTFSLTGQVTWAGSGLGGVTLSLSGTATQNTTTDGNGAFTFANLTSGTYTITTSKTACSFTPPSHTVSLSGSNVAGQDFTATCAQAPGPFTLSANAYCNTTPPKAPAVLLMWTPSTGAASYDVYRNGTLYQSGITGTQFNNTANVKVRQTYMYSVLARNSIGTAPSNIVTVAIPNTICTSPPPPPTITTVTLTANPMTITQGQSSTLTWSSTNATSCIASTISGLWDWIGPRDASGSQHVQPNTTTTYSLTCSGATSSPPVTASATVYPVIALTPCSPTVSSPSPSCNSKTVSINPGESVVFSVPTGTASPLVQMYGLAAKFGLEFRVSASGSDSSTIAFAPIYYVGDSVDVGSNTNGSYQFQAKLGSGLPNIGDFLPTTLQDTTYYVNIPNLSTETIQVIIQADLKEIQIVPLGLAVDASRDNYFIIHGRGDNYTSFKTLTDNLEAKINNTNNPNTTRYFRIDWSGAASSNYPPLFGLQGSRFIVPAGNALKDLVVTVKKVRASKISVWGHSWGAYVSSEFAKASGSTFKALVALDPANTTSISGFIGNMYPPLPPSQVKLDLSANVSHSFALVATSGQYGGQTEAYTAALSTGIRVQINNALGEELADYSLLHKIPIRCMEYSLSQRDAISQALVATALDSPPSKEISNQPSPLDAEIVGYTDNTGKNYIGHGFLQNGTKIITP